MRSTFSSKLINELYCINYYEKGNPSQEIGVSKKFHDSELVSCRNSYKGFVLKDADFSENDLGNLPNNKASSNDNIFNTNMHQIWIVKKYLLANAIIIIYLILPYTRSLFTLA